MNTDKLHGLEQKWRARANNFAVAELAEAVSRCANELAAAMNERPRSCPHSTSPLRYCDPCPVSPCPMEVEAAPSPPDSSQGEPVAFVRWGDFEPQLVWNPKFCIWDDALCDKAGNRQDLTLYAHAPSSPQVAVADVRLFDSQWVNVVNHENCYREYSKEDAVNKAVKLTEQYMRENIENGFPKPRESPQSAPKAAEPQCLFVETSREGTSYCRLNGPPQGAKGEPQARHWFDPSRMPSERDRDGYISHPDADLRIWFNGEPGDEAPLDPERFAELGLEVKFCTEEIEYADDDNRMGNQLNPPEKWDGNRPPGEGWRLGGTYPTEAGHAAFWVRSLAQADKDKTP